MAEAFDAKPTLQDGNTGHSSVTPSNSIPKSLSRVGGVDEEAEEMWGEAWMYAEFIIDTQHWGPLIYPNVGAHGRKEFARICRDGGGHVMEDKDANCVEWDPQHNSREERRRLNCEFDDGKVLPLERQNQNGEMLLDNLGHLQQQFTTHSQTFQKSLNDFKDQMEPINHILTHLRDEQPRMVNQAVYRLEEQQSKAVDQALEYLQDQHNDEINQLQHDMNRMLAMLVAIMVIAFISIGCNLWMVFQKWMMKREGQRIERIEAPEVLESMQSEKTRVDT